MTTKIFCQSCNMPLDNPKVKGTEKDGSKSDEYCKYCYEKGSFLNSDMSPEEIRGIVKTEMKKMYLPHDLIKMSIALFPNLNRRKEKIPVQ